MLPSQAIGGFWEGSEESHPPGALTLLLAYVSTRISSEAPQKVLFGKLKTKTQFANNTKPLATLPGAWANTGRKPLCTSAPLGSWRTANPTRPHVPIYSQSLSSIQVLSPSTLSPTLSPELHFCLFLSAYFSCGLCIPHSGTKSLHCEPLHRMCVQPSCLNWNQIVLRASISPAELLKEEEHWFLLLSPLKLPH